MFPAFESRSFARLNMTLPQNVRAHLAPFGCPFGMDPRAWRQSLEQQLEAMLDRQMEIIAQLDALDGDADFEPDADSEPSLGAPELVGCATPAFSFWRVKPYWMSSEEFAARQRDRSSWPIRAGDQTNWFHGGGAEEEEDANEDGGNVLDEPHDAIDEGNDEPSIDNDGEACGDIPGGSMVVAS